jgi:hypothetical protein
VVSPTTASSDICKTPRWYLLRCKTSSIADPSYTSGNFCASGTRGYTDYDEYYIDHGYLVHGYYNFGYIDIDIMAMSTVTHRLQLQSTASTSLLESMTLPL